jgi:integrase
VKEAALMRPHQADKGSVLYVTHGSKGGRDRTVKMENDFQRKVINAAKKMTGLNQSMVPNKYSYKEWRNHYYWIVRSHGINRKDLGVTSHGLRHERLNEIYKTITGNLSPIQGGKTEDKEIDRFARNIVAEVAGHSREDVSSTYLGGKS